MIHLKRAYAGPARAFVSNATVDHSVLPLARNAMVCREGNEDDKDWTVVMCRESYLRIFSRIGVIPALVIAAALPLLIPPADARAGTPVYEQQPIGYSAGTPHDPAGALNEAITSGKVKLTPEPERGYLDALLRALEIPASSQTLVFSKTSFQRNLISPANPRALYFNDDTYIGYVPGGDVLEVASSDPLLGTIFYTVSQHADEKAAAGTHDAGAAGHAEMPQKQLIRQTDICLQCHGESLTRDVPGLLVRSVFADAGGEPIFSAGTFLTTHQSPLAERWGGWYVTASAGEQVPQDKQGPQGQPQHMGNRVWEEQPAREGQLPPSLSIAGGEAKKLPAKVNSAAYLSPHSDIIALMVLEHQVEAHNRFTRATHGTLRALRDEKVMADALHEPLKPGAHSNSTQSRIKSHCEPLVEYLLFSDEATLGEATLNGPIEGSSKFATEFTTRGPRDSHGRSLRDFDLKSRLFRFPCSYLVYSRSFDQLPDAAREYVAERLWAVLSGKDQSKPFAHLTPADRAAILEILRETKPQLRAAWASK